MRFSLALSPVFVQPVLHQEFVGSKFDKLLAHSVGARHNTHGERELDQRLLLPVVQ